MIKRREFITLFGGAAATWPLAARAQQPDYPMRRVGVLTSYDESDPQGQAAVALFKKALAEAGWTEARNVEIVVSWGNDEKTIPARLKQIVNLTPDVILAHTTRMLKPLQTETGTIPIVFAAVSDPVVQGVVKSLARPGGNTTGFALPPFSVVGKSVQILKEVAPNLTRVGLLISASNGAAPDYFRAIDSVSKTLGIAAAKMPLSGDRTDLERNMDAFAHEPNGGIYVARDVFSEQNYDLFVRLAAKHRLPAIYGYRLFVDGGGLMSYGSDPLEPFRGAASYVDRILRGEKPGDLPVRNRRNSSLSSI